MTKPKVVIVTLHKADNYGAFLQAFALQEVLKSYGLDPFFLDCFPKDTIKKVIQARLKGLKTSFSSFNFHSQRRVMFKKAQLEFRVHRSSSIMEFDAAFFGSDEIWNLINPSFKARDEFFGIGVNTSKKFAYAPCTGESSPADYQTNPAYIASLCKFNLLSVRDSASQSLLTQITGCDNIPICLDPSFLFEFETPNTQRIPANPYILVYTYGMPPERVKEVKDYAKRCNMKLVAAGFWHSWCDYQLACSPLEFLGLIKNSSSVITDTFHGTVFAIKYRKNFLVYNKNKHKVSFLLSLLGLESNLVDTGALASLKCIRTDYAGVDELLRTYVAESIAYLDQCIDELA